jgi:heptosyltransferase I
VKALIVRLSSIGDVVHTLPAAAALTARGWETGWVVEPAALPLLSGNPAVAWATRAPAARAFRLGPALSAVRSLRSRRCDVALDLQGLWKSAVWARLSGARRVLGYGGPWRRERSSTLLLGERVDLPSHVTHVIDKNLALLHALGIDAVGSREFPLPRDPAVAESVEQRLATAVSGRYVVLNAGGGWASKLWPAERFGAVARALGERGVPSLVTWGPGEEALAESVLAASGGHARRCFATTLLELVEVLRRAQLVVAADTGPLHIACALGRPVVGLYGPTDPARNGPFASEDAVVRRAPACAPCHRRVCAVHEGVMATIPVDEVVVAVEARLATDRRRPHVAV